MIEVNVPKDILKHKTKFVANFTVRETVCLFFAAAFALFGYVYLFTGIPGKGRVYASAVLAVPFLVVGFMKLYDQPFEKMAMIIIRDNLLYPPIRKYEIRYPEYEKYRKTGNISEINAVDNEENGNAKAGKKKKSTKQQQKTAKAVKPSKEYKAIK